MSKGMLVGKCLYCGNAFEKYAGNQRYCSLKCRRLERDKHQNENRKKYENAKTKNKITGKSLNDLANEASELGLSYGKYVAHIERGMLI